MPLEVLGNARLIAIVESLRDQTRVRGLSTVGRTRDLRAIVTEHQAIYEAARDGRAARAAQAMERHLLITEELLRAQVGADGDAEGGGVGGVAPGGRGGSVDGETEVGRAPAGARGRAGASDRAGARDRAGEDTREQEE